MIKAPQTIHSSMLWFEDVFMVLETKKQGLGPEFSSPNQFQAPEADFYQPWSCIRPQDPFAMHETS